MARSAGGVAVSLAGLLLLCFSAAPCDGGSRMVLNEETGAIEIISSPGVQQVGGTPRGKRTESQKQKGPDFGAVRPGTPFREWFSGLWQRRSVTMPNVPDWPASQPERSSLDLATRPCRAPKAIGCFEQLEQFEQLDASPASRAAGLGTRSRAASDEIR